MKRLLRNVLLPAAFVVTAVCASFYVGWSVEDNIGQAELQALAPADRPVHAPVRLGFRRGGIRGFRGARGGQINYLSLADAEAGMGDILAGYLPSGARGLPGAIMQIASAMNPAEVAVLFDELPDGPVRDAMLRLVQQNGGQSWLGRWAQQDTKAALEWVGTLDPADAQGLYRAILIPVMAQMDPGSLAIDPKIAAQYLDKLTDPNLRNQAISVLAPNMASKYPAEALAWLGEVATGDAYTKGVTSMFKYLIAPELRTFQTNDGTYMSLTFGGSNGQHDPAAAIALLAKVDDSAVRTTAIGVIADGWANLDPAAAAKWAETLSNTDGTARATALNTIVTDWAKNDPVAAAAYVQSTNNPAAFQAAAPALADALAEIDPTAAMKFAQSLPEGASKDKALNNVLVNVSTSDFSTAWNLATNLPPGTSREAAMVSLVGEQAVWNPAQAVSLLDQFSNSSELNSASRTLAYAWVAQDPQAASTWMQTLSPGSQRDLVVLQLIPAVEEKDPTSALNWSNTLMDPAKRIDMVQDVMTTWAATDAPAALAALQSANITDGQKAAIAQAITQAQAKAK